LAASTSAKIPYHNTNNRRIPDAGKIADPLAKSLKSLTRPYAYQTPDPLAKSLKMLTRQTSNRPLLK
jgi:hypothetical protein